MITEQGAVSVEMLHQHRLGSHDINLNSKKFDFRNHKMVV